MTSPRVGASEAFDEFIAEARAILAGSERLRRRLPGGGQVHVDRPLPFLSVYRRPPGVEDIDTEELILGEASYLVASGEPDLHEGVSSLVLAVAETMVEVFGGFLLVEIWRAPAGDERGGSERSVRRPTFSVQSGSLRPDDPTIENLRYVLSGIPLRPAPLEVEVAATEVAHPLQLPPLISAERMAALPCHTIGIEVQPVYRQAKTGTPYPVVFRVARRGLTRALRQTFYHFAITHTSHRPEHHDTLGRRSAINAVWEADQRLREIDDSFDFLLQVTPVNTASAWVEFERSRFEREPASDYRPLVVNVSQLKRKLFAIRTEGLEDPTLAHLLDDKRNELDRQITMLADRNTPRFRYGSLQVYGGVDDDLLTLANDVLEQLPPHEPRADSERIFSSEEFARAGEKEIAHYREADPEMSATARVRGDISGMMVAKGHLLVGEDAEVPESRVEAMLHHEVGTHVVTHHNGRSQPLGLLATGLAGYNELQEGLAVTAEYLAGALGRTRMRVLAARVVAVRAMIDGATFVEAFRLLARDHDFEGDPAFKICMRVYRSGGFTKDATYLRGLVRMLDYLRSGGSLEPLYIGKISFAHIALVEELRWRRLLHAPPLTPRYFNLPEAVDRLARLRNGITVLDMISEETQ